MQIRSKFSLITSVIVGLILAPVTVFAITGADIDNGTIGTQDIADNHLTGVDIKNGSLGTQDVADNHLTGVDIKNGSLGTQDIADNHLTGVDIKDGSLSGDDLGEIEFLTAKAVLNTDYQVVGSGLDFVIADNGTGTAASQTLTWDDIQSSMGIDCQDSDGCTVGFADTDGAFVPGLMLTLHNVSVNSVTVSDTPGVAELSGDFIMGQWDTLQLVYQGPSNGNGHFLELNRSDN